MKLASTFFCMASLVLAFSASAQPLHDDGPGDGVHDREMEEQRRSLQSGGRHAQQIVRDLQKMLAQGRVNVRDNSVTWDIGAARCEQCNGACITFDENKYAYLGLHADPESLYVCGVRITERELDNYPLFREVYKEMVERSRLIWKKSKEVPPTRDGVHRSWLPAVRGSGL